MAGDPYWNNVVLAMHMDDAGLTDLKGHAVTLNGNAARSATQSKFGGYSAAFDGAGDYLSAGSNAAFACGAGDFTIECWVRFADVSAAKVIYDGRNLTQTSGVVLYLSAAAKLTFYTSSADRIVGTSSIAASTWYHVAICKSGGSTKLFLSGVQDGSTYSDSNNYTDTLVTIGADRAGTSMYMNGYIDDLRVTKGVARYTANFTPPTTTFPDKMVQLSGTVKDSVGNFAQRPIRAYRRSDGAATLSAISDAVTGAFSVPALDNTPHTVIALPVDGDPYWGNTVLALHMDGANGSTTFTDEKGHTVTPTTSTLSTVDKKFGTASLYYDGVAAGKLATAASADFALSGDFTIEGWFKVTADCPTCYLLSNGTTFAINVWVLEPTHATNPGKWCFFMHDLAVTGGPLVSKSDSLTNTWTHVAVTKQGALYRMFINGVLEATYINAGSMSANATDSIYVNSSAGRYKGYIDDLRITKGVARYVHDFTPPSSPFPHAITGGTENALIFDNITPV